MEEWYDMEFGMIPKSGKNGMGKYKETCRFVAVAGTIPAADFTCRGIINLQFI